MTTVVPIALKDVENGGLRILSMTLGTNLVPTSGTESASPPTAARFRKSLRFSLERELFIILISLRSRNYSLLRTENLNNSEIDGSYPDATATACFSRILCLA